MITFVNLIAASAYIQVSERRLFGKPFVKLGKLFSVVGSWVYQQGGVLGYGLQEHPVTLGKLLGATSGHEAEFVQSLGWTALSHLQEVENYQHTFHHLYLVREMRGLGIDLIASPTDKVLETKCKSDFASQVIRRSFHDGAALGYHFPGAFKVYWDHSYRIVPTSEWQEARSQVPGDQKTQQEQPLNVSVALMAETALDWTGVEAPNMLSDNELSVLKELSHSSE